jgi:hypothetical protein
MINTWVLRTEFDAEGFDYDGAGDYIYTDVDWTEFDTEAEVLKYLRGSVVADSTGKLAKFKTLTEYSETFNLQVFKRVY